MSEQPDRLPAVTIAVPTLNEERHIEACLGAVLSQDYDGPIEVLVVDGGSADRTRELAEAFPDVRVLRNPHRIQAAALNVALDTAAGEVFVRVDGHTVIAPDYVRRCVAALTETGAAIVGGGMTPSGQGWCQGGIAAAFRSPVGVGPARFHRPGPAAWADTVYLGAYFRNTAKNAGGYDGGMAVNEDAEFAIRMAPFGGVWYDPSIRSTYVPRTSIAALGRQFYRYGKARAGTVRRHPRSLRPRQLAAPLLILGLISPQRRRVLVSYAMVVGGAGLFEANRQPGVVPGFLVALPVMHVAWGLGFLVGAVRGPPSSAMFIAATSSSQAPQRQP